MPTYETVVTRSRRICAPNEHAQGLLDMVPAYRAAQALLVRVPSSEVKICAPNEHAQELLAMVHLHETPEESGLTEPDMAIAG